MATWKKVIVSGSDISQLNNDLNFAQEGVAGQNLSGSFSGSFEGDGSGLTGVVGTISNALTDGNGIADFSYDGSTSGVTVAVEADGATLTVGASGVKVSDSGIDTDQLANDAVTNDKIADDAVDTAQLADGAVDADRLASDSVTLGKIADGAFSVTGSGDVSGQASISGDSVNVSLSLGSEVVDTAELADDAVTNAKIASDAVNGDSIADGSISTAMFSGSALVTESEGIASNDVDTAVPTAAAVKDYVDTQITAEDLDISTDSGNIDIDLDSETLGINGKSGRGIAVSGSGTDVTIEISDGGVTNDMLAGSIANAKLSNSSITVGDQSTALGGTVLNDLTHSATGSFTGSFVGDGSNLTGVQASDLANSLTDGNGIADFTFDGSAAASIAVQADGSTLSVSATGVKVADSGIDTDQLANDAVTNDKIADDAVDTAQLADGAVDADRLAADSVTLGKIADAAFSVTASGDATGQAALSGDAIALSLSLGSGVVDTSELATGAVTDVKIASGSIQNNKLANDSINFSDGTNPETVSLGGTLTIRGVANETDVEMSGQTYTVGLRDDVTITQDLTVGRNLVVQGTASFQHTEDLAIADRFILLASGSSSAGDGGIVVQQTTQDVGEVFAFDNANTRWGVSGSFDASQNAFTPDAFMAAVSTGNFSSDSAIQAGIDSRYSAKGNIFIGDDQGIWIYS
mgnify:CR=1 FL=1